MKKIRLENEDEGKVNKLSKQLPLKLASVLLESGITKSDTNLTVLLF